MFIDYVALLLVNMVAGHFLLAHFVAFGLDSPQRARWAPGFLMTGLVALVFGAAMTITWPIPGAFSSAFGEMSVLWGIIFLGAGWAMARGLSLGAVTGYAFFAGVAAIIIGLKIIELRLTLVPVMSGRGFILSGAAGVLAAPTLVLLRHNRPLRMLAALVVIAAGIIWALTAYGSYAAHMSSFSKWVPLLMRGANGQP